MRLSKLLFSLATLAVLFSNIAFAGSIPKFEVISISEEKLEISAAINTSPDDLDMQLAKGSAYAVDKNETLKMARGYVKGYISNARHQKGGQFCGLGDFNLNHKTLVEINSMDGSCFRFRFFSFRPAIYCRFKFTASVTCRD